MLFLFTVLGACGGGGGGNDAVVGNAPGDIADDPGSSGEVLQGAATGADTGASVNSVQALHVRWFSIRDPLLNGIEAMKLLVPDGWSVNGGIEWHIAEAWRNGGVTRDYSVISPDSSRGIEFRPARPYVWDQTLAQQFGIGGFYGLEGAYIRQPMSALDYIDQVVLPELPYEVLAVQGRQEMPAVAAALSAGPYGGNPTNAAFSRIAFRSNGIDFEGEVHAWLTYLDQPTLAGGVTTGWMAERVFLIYAPAGQIDDASAQLYPLVVSEVVNPAWAELVAALERQRIANNGVLIAQTAEFAAQVQRNSAETFALIDQTFRDANAANDRIFDSYDQYLRGVESWQDPLAGPIELPSGYDQVWSNTATGEYLMVNDPSFDPNVTLTGNWTPLGRG